MYFHKRSINMCTSLLYVTVYENIFYKIVYHVHYLAPFEIPPNSSYEKSLHHVYFHGDKQAIKLFDVVQPSELHQVIIFHE